MHNFKLENIDVPHFLEMMKLRNVEEATQDEYRFSCPFPGHKSGDQNASAYMNSNSTAWYCHGCKRKGNAITFVSDIFNISSFESINHLKEYYGGGFQNPESTLEDEINLHFMEFGKPDQEPINYSLQLSVLSDFKINQEMLAYLHERGFNRKSIEEFQLGYDDISERIVIPIFDEVGRLVGFKGRSIDPEVKPKYKVIGGSNYGFPRYHVGLVIFAIDKVSEKEKTAIICEGEFNAIAMHQMGYKNAIAAGGSTFTPTHAKKIIDRFDSAYLYFDTDKAGIEATRKATDLLMPHMPVFVFPDHEYDAADLLVKFAPKGQRMEVEGLLSGVSGMMTLMVE